MKPTFTDLTEDEQKSFGNGCSYVPDFIFTADCRHHDFNYARGYRLLDKIKADYDLCRLMWRDSYRLIHYAISLVFWIGLTFTPPPYFLFQYGDRYKTLDEIKNN